MAAFCVLGSLRKQPAEVPFPAQLLYEASTWS